MIGIYSIWDHGIFWGLVTKGTSRDWISERRHEDSLRGICVLGGEGVLRRTGVGEDPPHNVVPELFQSTTLPERERMFGQSDSGLFRTTRGDCETPNRNLSDVLSV